MELYAQTLGLDGPSAAMVSGWIWHAREVVGVNESATDIAAGYVIFAL
jgi:hypothetical protein